MPLFVDVPDTNRPLRSTAPRSQAAVVAPRRPGRGEARRRAAVAPLWLAATLPADAREPQLLRLAGALSRFSSRLSLEPPDALVLEIRGSLRLFGDLESLRRQAVAVCSGCAAVRLAVAATPLAALWLSRAGLGDAPGLEALAGRLARVPLAACRWPPEAVQLLQRMGVENVGDCLRLPRDGLTRRVGSELLASLDRALGRRPDPRPSWRPQPNFHRRLELGEPTRNRKEMLAAAAVLLEALTVFLRARQVGVQRLDLFLEHSGGNATRVRVEGARSACDASQWQLLLVEHLHRLVLPEPVIALVLRGGAMEPLSVSVESLLEDSSSEAPGVLRLIERLQARLGREAVHALGLYASHAPEAAWRREAAPGAGKPQVPGPEAPRRPLWLLPQPLALPCDRGWPCHGGRLVLEQGPERIESGWWEGGDVARDYYLARNPAGDRLWVYRRRRHPRRWYLHGFF